MARFRLMLVALTVWLIILFNLTRPEILVGSKDFSINISPLVYVIAAATVLLLLLLPDLGRTRLTLVFLPVLGAYITAKFLFPPDPEGLKRTIYYTITEIVVLFLTVAVVRMVSLAVSTFEKAVENVIVRSSNSRILSTADGKEEMGEELLRARRFDRSVGFICFNLETLDAMRLTPVQHLTVEGVFQSRYLQGQIGQIVEANLYRTDILAWDSDNLIVCLPESNSEQCFKVANDLHTLIRLRLNTHVSIGIATFPKDGLIYEDLVRTALNTPITFEDDQSQEPPSDQTKGGSDDGKPESEQIAPVAAAQPVPEGARQDEQPKVPEPAAIRPRSIMGLYQWTRETYQSFYDWLPLPAPPKNFGPKGPMQPNDPDYWFHQSPYQSASSRSIYRIFKRIIDITLVVMSAPVTVPLAALVAALIYLDDRGPILFVQPRTGLGGRRFKMYKFRSMVVNAEERLRELAALGLAELDANGKLAKPLKPEVPDPRVTRLGRFIRKTSLDELPQLINVIRGDMSLVGPRPTSWDLNSYTLLQTERLSVQPGITGLWQVCSRGTTDFNLWTQWDILYIDKMSLSLDVQILMHTVGQVMRHRGAR